VVLLSQVIAHHCNIGYESYSNLHLSKFNGESVTNIRELKNKLEGIRAQLASVGEDTHGPGETTTPDQHLMFEMSNGRVIILDAVAAFKAQEQVRPSE